MKFQEPRLFPWLTVKQNVTAVLEDKNADSIAEKWLSAVGLTADLDKYPSELSGGMAQRVALARALAYGGDLLLLDEPFSAVDEATKAPLLDLIREYAKDHAIILVTHNEEEAKLLNAKILTL
ncbi:MAG: ABC transporter ATP-binding protein [Clostridia bacterium]|nr:ABC transporter ATP-binding protein [Clostridia bacterium]